jgi:hypothetical protein
MSESMPLSVAKLKNMIASAIRKPTWLTDEWVDSDLTGEHTCREYARHDEMDPVLSRVQLCLNSGSPEPTMAILKVPASVVDE